jgi:ferredoxin--NADP+ reductase
MHRIIEKKTLAQDVTMMRLAAPDIASRRKAGQFVILRLDEAGERIPLTIAASDEESITIISQQVGASTAKLALLKEGDSIPDLVGPLGKPTHLEKWGRVIGVGGGVGTAPILPILKAAAAAGNQVTGITGFRNKELVILEEEMQQACSELIVCTDDGSYGYEGFVTGALREQVDQQKPDMVLAVGPVVMMRAVCQLTKEQGIPTMVSLNPIMVDGTGMCGACRVTIDGVTKFACVDGPEFDGHLVDFEEMMSRQRTYLDQEKIAHQACDAKAK